MKYIEFKVKIQNLNFSGLIVSSIHLDDSSRDISNNNNNIIQLAELANFKIKYVVFLLLLLTHHT